MLREAFQKYLCILRASTSVIASSGACSPWLEPLPDVTCLACWTSTHSLALATQSTTGEADPTWELLDSSDPQISISTSIHTNIPQHSFKTDASPLDWEFSRCSVNYFLVLSPSHAAGPLSGFLQHYLWSSEIINRLTHDRWLIIDPFLASGSESLFCPHIRPAELESLRVGLTFTFYPTLWLVLCT